MSRVFGHLMGWLHEIRLSKQNPCQENSVNIWKGQSTAIDRTRGNPTCTSQLSNSSEALTLCVPLQHVFVHKDRAAHRVEQLQTILDNSISNEQYDDAAHYSAELARHQEWDDVSKILEVGHPLLPCFNMQTSCLYQVF